MSSVDCVTTAVSRRLDPLRASRWMLNWAVPEDVAGWKALRTSLKEQKPRVEFLRALYGASRS